MNVDGSKIKELVRYYGELKDYEEKSHLAKFCEDWTLNYNQWNAYTRNSQAIGWTIIQKLMEIFPKLSLNWLVKDIGPRFLDEIAMEVNEPKEKIKKEISNEILYEKLEKIHFDVLHLKLTSTK